MKFGVVPPEVPVDRRLDVLAPKFLEKVRLILRDLEGGRPEWLFETLRSDRRAAYLFGFGRAYDDGRGVVTNARTGLLTWHRYGLAIDVVEKDGSPWDAPAGFWEEIGRVAKRHGQTWGGDWVKPDRPHIQFGACPKSPTKEDQALVIASGMEAVWAKYGAA